MWFVTVRALVVSIVQRCDWLECVLCVCVSASGRRSGSSGWLLAAGCWLTSPALPLAGCGSVSLCSLVQPSSTPPHQRCNNRRSNSDTNTQTHDNRYLTLDHLSPLHCTMALFVAGDIGGTNSRLQLLRAGPAFARPDFQKGAGEGQSRTEAKGTRGEQWSSARVVGLDFTSRRHEGAAAAFECRRRGQQISWRLLASSAPCLSENAEGRSLHSSCCSPAA